jgi:hypothetical protein
MSTPAQAAANLANAQQSTGPTTDAGKAASSQNALKHGLTAKTVLLPGEDEAAYAQMCQGMFATFGPANTPEKELVQLLCDTQWRLQRCGRIEAAILSAGVLDFKALDIMSKHESRLKKQYSVTLKEARDLIDTRLTRRESQMKEAITVRRADRMNNRTTDLQKIGFVFSTEEVDAAIHAQDALAQAKMLQMKHRLPDLGGYALISDLKKPGR